MAGDLVLSIFPGIDLLGRAFEEEGFTVVRGPDALWGGDIHGWHAPPGVFAGVIGGPPCQWASRMVHMVRKVHGESAVAENLIPEYLRIVHETAPRWWVMENAKESPPPELPPYRVESMILNNRQFGEMQNRERRISVGTCPSRSVLARIDLWYPIHGDYETAVLSTSRTVAVALDRNHRPKPRRAQEPMPRSIGDLLALQGFPRNLLDDAPFTDQGKRKVIANGVTRPMGLAVAKAIRRAME